ncbi:MAG: phenylalanine--tRNA ligase subunit beta [Clostridia bacterium]
MIISLNWLKEYVDLDDDISIQEIVDRLTISGTKVEKYVEFGKKTNLVYTGKVKSIDKLDDKLNKIVININDKEYISVANIDNLNVGDVIPVALVNAKLFNKQVKETIIHNITSNCTICHISDLGLNKDMFSLIKSNGLIVFPDDVKVGVDVTKLLGLGDYIIEFEITPNRTDCMSVEGVARELAVTFDKKCNKLFQDEDINITKIKSNFVNVLSNNCKKYMLGNVNNIKINNLPFEYRLKLIKSGMSSINNIVDITNYVMLELGQPLHAFDKDKVSNITVKEITSDIVTLDKVNRHVDDSLCICDNDKVIAVAGVMGCENSMIDDNTKNILIESASFYRGSVRNSSKKLSLRTDASTNYEKGLPSMLTEKAINRCINLMSISNIGDVNFDVIDVDNTNYIDRIIDLDYKKINDIIGTKISNTQIDNILNSLNLKVNNNKITVPYYRQDIENSYDLAEEVARIYGYDKLESTLPKTELTIGIKNNKQKYIDKLSNISRTLGYDEICTYSFYSYETRNKIIGSFNEIKLLNPLSVDFELMRQTTIPHMLDSLEKNNLYKNEEVKLYDIGKIFLNNNNISKGKLDVEEDCLTLGFYSKKDDFYTLKQAVDTVLYKLDLRLQRSINETFHKGISGEYYIDNILVAEFGKISPKVIKNYNLNENTFVGVIYIDRVINKLNKDIEYKQLPKFPSVKRDISFEVDKSVLSISIIQEIKNISDIVEDVKLFDVYEGDKIDKNKKSVAYSIILRSNTHTLIDSEIVSFMDTVDDILKNNFKTSLRGK